MQLLTKIMKTFMIGVVEMSITFYNQSEKVGHKKKAEYLRNVESYLLVFYILLLKQPKESNNNDLIGLVMSSLDGIRNLIKSNEMICGGEISATEVRRFKRLYKEQSKEFSNTIEELYSASSSTIIVYSYMVHSLLDQDSNLNK